MQASGEAFVHLHADEGGVGAVDDAITVDIGIQVCSTGGLVGFHSAGVGVVDDAIAVGVAEEAIEAAERFVGAVAVGIDREAIIAVTGGRFAIAPDAVGPEVGGNSAADDLQLARQA